MTHLLVPFAAGQLPAFEHSLSGLRLPHLSQLLSHMALQHSDDGSEDSLSPPHERVLARACGLPDEDGGIPWAALEHKRQNGTPLPPNENDGPACAWVTPCHWQVRIEGVLMPSLSLMSLDENVSRNLLAIVSPLFSEAGIKLYYDQPLRWLACGEIFRGMRTASLDRVQGTEITPWLQQASYPGSLRVLMSELQMTLHQHSWGERQQAQGQLPVNAFWFSGAGALPHGLPVPDISHVRVADGLRNAALDCNLPAWVQAWQALDSTLVAELLRLCRQGRDVRLTLCGERNAQTFACAKRSFWQRLRACGRNIAPADILRQL